MNDENLTQRLSVVESPAVMRFPLLVLSLASLWPIVSFNPFDFNGWIFSGLGGASQHLFPWLSLASVAWIALAVALAFVRRGSAIQAPVLYEAFYFDKLIQRSVEVPALMLASATRQLDKRWIDGTLHTTAYAYTIVAHVAGWFDRFVIDGLVDGIAWSTRMIGYWIRRFQRDGVQLYVFWAVFAIIIFIIWTLL